MKEVRAFLETAALNLLPLTVLLLALYSPARAKPAMAAGEPPAPPAGEASVGKRNAGETASGDETAGEAAAGEPAEEAEATGPAAGDASVTVRILNGGEIMELPLRDYLIGVVAAEMPASFEPEALAAQAVAARTDTLYRLLVARPHDGAACCTDPGCCKAYASPEELRDFWGGDYGRWLARIEAAVDATDGEIVVWDGEPIFAAFHASSEGSTEASENVWQAALPYLRSVPTGETAADVPGFLSSAVFSAEELRTRLLDRCPGADLSGPPDGWLTEARRSEAGRLLSLRAGGEELSGGALRSLLGLRSTAVTWRCEDGVFTFESAGFGHGVGLSQYGAEVMALGGADHREILLHYYSGTELAEMDGVFRA